MKFNFTFFATFLIIFLPVSAQAADFVGLVGIPGLSDAEVSTRGGGLNKYINTLYRLSISIAALLAVIKIVMAGAKYMLSDIVTHKEDAKKDIQGALIGLLIVIGAIVILNTVNSDLTKLDLNIQTAEIKQGEMTLDEAIRRATAAAQTEQDAVCASTNGGCTFYPCQALMDEVVSYAAAGCAIGGTALGVSWGVAGSAIPVLGNIAGLLTGAGLGCAGGAITGAIAGSYGNEALCKSGCSISGGYFNDITKECAIPKNSELLMRNQLETASVASDNTRAEVKTVIASNNPVNDPALINYFGVEQGYFNTLQAATTDTDIVIADRPLLAARLGLPSAALLEENISRVSQTAIYKEVSFDEVGKENSEYNVMLANAETKIRAACSGGEVTKMQVTESSQATLGGARILTRYYCIK